MTSPQITLGEPKFVGNGATLTFNTVFALDGGLAAWPIIAKELLAAQQNRSGELLLGALPAQGIAANASVECADRLFPTSKALCIELARRVGRC